MAVNDEELKKAFTELQEKMVDTTHKLKLADLQIESLKRSRQRAELTIKEMNSLPGNARTFESVGRMFLLQDIETIKKDLGKKVITCEDKVKTLENSKSYMQKSLKDFEDNIREMVKRRRSQP